VLGFLSVSTEESAAAAGVAVAFQSRAGFSECLDDTTALESLDQQLVSIPCWVF